MYRLKSSGESCCFLSTGDLVISLFPRSLCWCVDGVARFAIRIQQHIYRFEFPHETDEDKAGVEAFKAVLSGVLYYERAPCPFIRGFAQEHAEELPSPKSKGRRRPSSKARHWQYDARWRPEDDPDYNSHRPGSSGSLGESESSASDATEDEYQADTPTEPMAPLRVDKKRPGVAAFIKSFDKYPLQVEPTRLKPQRPRPDTGQQPRPSESTNVDTPALVPASSKVVHARDESVATVTPATFGRPATPPPDASSSLSRTWVEAQPSPLTPPPSGTRQDKADTTSPVAALAATAVKESTGAERKDQGDEGDEDDRDDKDYKDDADGRNATDRTIFSTDSTEAERNVAPLEPRLETESSATPLAPVPEDAPIVQEAFSTTAPVTPERTVRESVRRRRTASPRSHQRFRSQEIPSYILDDVSSQRIAARASSSAATMNMLSKTFELMMSPPSGLLQIMVQIAARIRQYGASGAAVFSIKSMRRAMRAQGRALPGRWTSDDEDDSEPDEEDDDEKWAAGPNEDDEDDFGVPLGVETPARNRRMDWGSGPLQ